MLELGWAMNVQKISVSLPIPQYEFLSNYQEEHNCKTRSEVINKALILLQQSELEAAYKEAGNEVDPIWDHTNLDGLDKNEIW